MFGWFAVLWEKLRTSIWLLPVAMVCLALLLRQVAFWADDALGDSRALQLWWLHSGSGDDARNLLSTLVAALITMASVMFSITMVVLSLAANQFGSRLVRTYMADLRTQAAIGTFVMTIVYCLLVLRTVQKDMPAEQVPHIAVSLGLFLALVCVLTLLFFLHVVARSMVADDVIRRVAAELEYSIENLPALGEERDAPKQRRPDSDRSESGAIVASREEGYVQTVDYDGLLDLATRHDVRIRLHCKAGAFMCLEGWLAEVTPRDAAGPDIAKGIQKRLQIGNRRTPTQDLEFSIRHLVDIALRALSPGINDPNTAVAVIDRLRGALSRLMAKRIPSTSRRDESGALRVIGKETGYGDILDAALHQIRQAGAVHPAVVIHLLGAIDRLAEHVRLPDQREALLHHAHLIAEAGLREAQAARDRADIEAKRDAALAKLNSRPTVRRPAMVASAAAE